MCTYNVFKCICMSNIFMYNKYCEDKFKMVEFQFSLTNDETRNFV